MCRKDNENLGFNPVQFDFELEFNSVSKLKSKLI